MEIIFEVTDKTGRKIRLTKERWSYIRKKHPEVETHEEIEEGIKKSDKITFSDSDDTVHYFYKYYKNKKGKLKFLKTAVKYLNGEGFVVTAYYIGKIR